MHTVITDSSAQSKIKCQQRQKSAAVKLSIFISIIDTNENVKQNLLNLITNKCFTYILSFFSINQTDF